MGAQYLAEGCILPPSIDNYYLLLAIMHGTPALVCLLGVIFVTPIRLFLFEMKQTARGPRGSSFGFTLISIYVAIGWTIATVYMGAQLMPLLFIVTGWAEGYLVCGNRNLAEMPQKAHLPTSLPLSKDSRMSTTRLAYLVSRYPSVSHTFILREVLCLRELGIHIRVASINPADRPPAGMTAEECAEHAGTFYVKHAGISRLLVAALFALATRPRACLRGLFYSMRLGASGHPQNHVRIVLYFAEALLVGKWMATEIAARISTCISLRPRPPWG